MFDPPEAAGVFLEAADAAKGLWRVRVIRAGVSRNGVHYPAALLREAAPRFAGVRVFAKSDAEHLRGEGKDVRNLIGVLREPRFVEAAGGGAIEADLKLLEPEGSVAVKLREAAAQGMLDLMGLSIDAHGGLRRVAMGGRVLREAAGFSRINSVDLIVEPGAGGGFISFKEALDPMRDELLRFLEAAGQSRADLEALDDKALLEAYDKARAPKVQAQPDPAPAPAPQPGVTPEQLREALAEERARGAALARIDASHLPEAARARLRGDFEARARFTEAEVGAAITAEGEYLARFTEAGRVTGLGMRVEPGESQPEKTARMLEAYFDAGHKDHRHARSFRKIYADLTGDHGFTGQLANMDQAHMREAMGTSDLPATIAMAVRAAMMRDYARATPLDAWRRVATVGQVADLEAHTRLQWGGLGDLPKVAEAAAYTDLGNLPEREEEFSAEKRGGTASITWETILADRNDIIRRIPTRMADAAKRTLSRGVFSVFTANPVMGDTVAMFHASKNNLGAAALSEASYEIARRAVMAQPEAGSTQPIFIPPSRLLIPAALEKTAYDLFRQDANQEKSFVHTLRPELIPVWSWTDANDWVLACDPAEFPGLEVAFLNGQEEPEIFVQDQPTSGSVFTNDRWTFKVRHVWGVAVLDRRPFYKAVVA